MCIRDSLCARNPRYAIVTLSFLLWNTDRVLHVARYYTDKFLPAVVYVNLNCIYYAKTKLVPGSSLLAVGLHLYIPLLIQNYGAMHARIVFVLNQWIVLHVVGTNNARLATMLRQLAIYHAKDPNNLFCVRIAQGLTHLSKGTLTLCPYHADRQIMNPVAVAGLLTFLVSCLDVKTSKYADTCITA